MSTMSTTGLYDEDLHGTNPANLIDSEIQTLQVPSGDDYYFIIPKAAPFFADSMEVYNALTGDPYVENDDFLLGHYFIEAMDSIGRPICGSIRFMKRTIQGQVRLRYRTIGGQWGFSDQAILAELSNRQNNPLIRSWAQIDVLPALFPPLEHSQPVNSLVGSKEILAALENLAEIMEAAAEGASQSHLTDFGNPHKVTAAQVLLGNVPNYAAATDPEAIAGTKVDALMTPRGTFLQIQEKALKPLNAHINQTGNVHNMVAADINLGNVPNFRKATPTDAVDITNDNTLMTPYTTSLLIEKLSNLARIDDLENLIKDHIADTNNPHELTPAILGMYSNAEIDQKIANAQGGGDADTFGGKTPLEWEDSFVSSLQGETIITRVTDQHVINNTNYSALVTDSPWTPDMEAAFQRTKVGAAQSGYNSYMVVNADNYYRVIAASDAPPIPDVSHFGINGFSTAKNASYVVQPNGSILAVGADAIQAPNGWKDDANFLPANRCDSVWATGNKVYVRKWVPDAGTEDNEIYGDVYSYDAGGNLTLVVPTAVGMVDLFTSSQHKYVGETTVIEKTGSVFEGVGTSGWVTAITTALNYVRSQLVGDDVIRDVRVGDDHVIIATEADGTLYIYNIVRAGQTVTGLTLVNNPVFTVNGLPTTTIGTSFQITGAYDHFAILLEDRSVAFYGDTTQGQAEVDSDNGPFLSVAAGNGFTVTVNDQNQTVFWGNSPDNSMLYGRRGITVPTPGVTP